MHRAEERAQRVSSGLGWPSAEDASPVASIPRARCVDAIPPGHCDSQRQRKSLGLSQDILAVAQRGGGDAKTFWSDGHPLGIVLSPTARYGETAGGREVHGMGMRESKT